MSVACALLPPGRGDAALFLLTSPPERPPIGCGARGAAGGHCFRLEETKEGASVRPVGRPVWRLLEGAERRPGCEYVLPAVRGPGPYGGLQGGFERLMKRAGLTGVTPHTLRHSYASMAGDLGFSEPTIAALIGHAAGTTTSRYIHHLDSVLIAAADRVATAIESYALGHQTPAEVTSLLAMRS
jgi:Phage integrase family